MSETATHAWVGGELGDFRPDVIVVGSGSAGCAVTRRLVDRGDLRVLLLEAGGPDVNPAIHEPARVHELWFSEEDWAYETVPQRHASDRRLHWPRGKVLGGSSCLNAMIWVRGNPADYDDWAYNGADGWSWDDVRPVFERVERRDPASDGGIVDLTIGFTPDPIHEALAAASVECGLPLNQDYNGERQDGVSFMQFTIRDGVRRSAAATYLYDIAEHPNLRVLTRATARRLLF
jgi:choline dehydrogenase